MSSHHIGEENIVQGAVVPLFPNRQAPDAEQVDSSVVSPPVISGQVVDAKAVTIRHRIRTEGTPLCPADAGLLRYAASVAGHGAIKTPVAVWDRWWDWAKLAPMREGGTHRGALAERHQQAYVKIQATRGERSGRVARVLTLPWHTRVKVGKFPVAVGTWTVTTGEAVYAVNPTSELLAATIGTINGWLGVLMSGAAELAAPVAIPAAAVAGIAALGHSVKVEHFRRRRALRVREGVNVGVREDGELLPAMALAECLHANMVLEAARRNLAIEQILAKPLSAQHVGWGWEVVVQLKKGTPADIAAKARSLETLFDVAENAVLPQPHRDRRARVTLRLIESDPWADMPQVPDYTLTPRVATDPIWLGQRLDGVPLASAFAGKQSIILAASGGGKSIVIRVIGDGLGAASDVHIWDLDPSGVGQAPQARLMGKTALTPQDCEKALTQALAIASARTRLLRKLGMGDAWVSSPQRPTLAILLDEFPRLTNQAKANAVSLLRIARKAGVVLIFATQDNKGKTIGESIAGQVAFKAGGPGLIDWQADLLWGPGCKARGWDPGRYAPATSQDQPNDAGIFFLSGTGTPGGDVSLPSKVAYISGATATARASRYAELGRLPKLDTETLAWAELTPEEVYTHTDTQAADIAQHLAALTDEQEEQEEVELTDDARDLLAVCADVFGDADSEWIPALSIVDAAVRELGWPAGKATETRVAELLDGARVAKDRKRLDGQQVTARLRAGLLAASGMDVDHAARTA